MCLAFTLQHKDCQHLSLESGTSFDADNEPQYGINSKAVCWRHALNGDSAEGVLGDVPTYDPLATPDL